MNRSYSRFNPHRPAAFRPRYGRPGYAARPVRRMTQEIRTKQPRKSYWFPIATMMAAVLFAASAVMPRSLFDAFASGGHDYEINVESMAGSYSVTVTGSHSTGIDLPADSAVKTVNEDGTVTFTLTLDDDTDYTIDSAVPFTDTSFGSGASAVTSVEADSSGIKNIDVSNCTNLQTLSLSDCPIADIDLSGLTSLSYVNLKNTPVATAENADHLVVDNANGYSVSINAPEYTAGEDCIEFAVDGLGEASDLTLTINDGSAVSRTGDKYTVPNSTLRKIFGEQGTIYVRAVNSSKPKVTYLFDISPENLPDSSILAASGNSTPSDDQGGTDTPSDDQGGTDTPSDNQGGTDTPSDDQGGTDTPSDDQGGTDTPSDDQGGTNTPSDEPEDNSGDDVPNAALTIESGSKSIIKNAYIEKNDEIDYKNLKIVAKALSAADKKAFLALIKKEDKDFNDSDSNLMVYDISLVNSKGKKVSVQDKSAVTVTLAYPTKQVEYLRDEYDFAIYHQLADKSIDTSIDAYPTKDGIQFTTDSFSRFAIASVAKEQEYIPITVDQGSKKFASAAKAHEGADFVCEDDSAFDGDGLTLVVKKPTDEEKKEFLAAIKKADKKFNDKDKNLMVYEVHLEDGEQHTVKLQDGKVDFTLAYPNDTVKKAYSKYNYTVYHQLADKKVDTKQLAVGGKDGIMITTDGFSLFAVASTPVPAGSDVPATGEANAATNIAVLLALLSLFSFAGVYAKNKAEQY